MEAHGRDLQTRIYVATSRSATGTSAPPRDHVHDKSQVVDSARGFGGNKIAQEFGVGFTLARGSVYLKYAVTLEQRSGGRRDLACFAFLESAGPIDRSRYVISRAVLEFAMRVRAIRCA